MFKFENVKVFQQLSFYNHPTFQVHLLGLLGQHIYVASVRREDLLLTLQPSQRAQERCQVEGGRLAPIQSEDMKIPLKVYTSSK